MANTTNIIPNKLTMYQRVEGGVWHYRIKLKTGEWYRLSSRETDFDEAKEIANRTYYTADYKEKNRLPQTTRRFKNVAKYALTRLEDELDRIKDVLKPCLILVPISLLVHTDDFVCFYESISFDDFCTRWEFFIERLDAPF